ncbi:MAG: GGDEF domain-containing protein [Magnetococcales bacterium]|nr:GGDEF domain-containing protein [Magnetococcales bacterium]
MQDDAPLSQIVDINPLLATTIVDITAQSDEISLTQQLVQHFHKLVPVRDVHYYQLVQTAEGGGGDITKWFIVDPLDRDRRMRPVTDIDGIPACLEHGEQVAISRLDTNQARAVYPVRSSSNLMGFLTVDWLGDTPHSASLITFLLDIFSNQALLITSKERDSLTKLYNRQVFNNRILNVVETASHSRKRLTDQTTKQFCLGMLDIDHFKRVNDQHGHLMGDEVLVLFARLMRRNFRFVDQLFRYGGEEFIVILHEVTEEEAFNTFERMRRNIETFIFPGVGKVTTSIGFAHIHENEVPATLIEKADRALYYAKQHGRNSIQCFQTLVAEGKLSDINRASDDIEMWK